MQGVSESILNFPGLFSQFYTSFSPKADCERAVNLYCERIESGQGVNDFAMYRSPGLLAKAEPATAAPARGEFELNDHLFRMVGATLYELLSDYSVHATYGPFANDNGPVYFAANPDTLAIVSAGHFYRIYSATLTEPAIFGTPLNVAFLSNYFILLYSDNTFGYSDDVTATTWDALDVQSAEASANAFVSMLVDHQTLFIYGNRITQAFLVGSDANTPFVAQQNGVIPVGIAAAATVVSLAGNRYWIGQNKEGGGIAYKGAGYDFERISTHAIENAWRGYGDLSDASAWVYQLNGHSCVRFYFPTAGKTWEYDTTTGLWAEMAWLNPISGLYEAHRGSCGTSAFGKILLGDRVDGTLYEMSPDFYDDNGDVIRWLRVMPHLIEKNLDVAYDRFMLGCQVGVGLNVAEGVLGYDPQIMMRYSDDGGNTWSNELSRSMGRAGQYKTQVYWDRLGVGHDRVFEISGTDPVKLAITAGWFDGEVLD